MKDIIEDILIYIEENIFLDELKIEDISAHFGYDKHHFSREFKRLTGYSLR
ncbi:helix-turn-helix transcriptional regulator [Enterococcus raffinosus]|uniref:helix-turn-helix transcriptional regulator n=1 Tax=Enterococcus raffinosus TaxID=71452 RepID=UPI00209DD92B|nr:helix-turn-helix transcriptional regulator [Enterococcus raffinosus]